MSSQPSKEALYSDPNMKAVVGHLLNVAKVKSSERLAKQATDRAAKDVTEFMKKHDREFKGFLNSAKPEHALRMRLSRISKRYFLHKYNQTSSINNVNKKELFDLAQQYEKLIQKLDSLSPASHIYFAVGFYEYGIEANDFLSKTKDKLSSDLEVLRSLVSKNRGRGSPEIPHVKSAAEAAAMLFTRCSGRRFKKNIHTTRRGGKEFVELDSLFVETLLRGIDPEITFANVRTALKAIPVD